MTQTIAVIGCGFFAQHHLKAWSELPNANLVAVCDTDPNKANAAARAFSAVAYTNPITMLQFESISVVDIVAPVAAHADLIRLVASYGKNIICQKPLAANIDEARALVSLCATNGVSLTVHENFRWQAAIQAAKYHAARLGKLHYLRLHWRTAYDVYSNQPYLANESEFILADLGIHLLDVARYLIGEVRLLYCQTQHINPQIIGEDSAIVLLEFENGASGIVELSYASPSPTELFPQTLLELEGTTGRLSLEANYQLRVAYHNHNEFRSGLTEHIIEETFLPNGATAIVDSVKALQKNWLECQQQGIQTSTNGIDNLHSLELVFAAYKSARTKRAVKP
jgi:D-apiose dehydrogenase